MSVVNQMLRDLDRRHSSAGEGLPHYLRPVAASRGKRTGWRIAAVLAASVAVGAGSTWFLKGGHAGLATLLGSVPGAPALFGQARDQGGVPQIASLTPASAVVPPDSAPVPAPPVQAPLPPAVIEQVVPRPEEETADVTYVTFAQTEVVAPPVMLSAEEVAAQPRQSKKTAAKADAPTPRRSAKIARRAPERRAPTAVESPRDTIEKPANPASVATAAKTPRIVESDPPAKPAASAKQTAEPPKPAPVADAAASGTVVASAQAVDAESPNAPRVDKQLRDPARPTADAKFRQAVTLMNQGRIDDAMARLREALALSPAHHQARQMLVALLVERRALDAARRELEEGLRQSPEQIGFASLLARLLVDQGDASGALEVLEGHAAYASASPQYRSFHAALLQRAGRHAEAVEEFRAALTISPVVGSWWMGLGISEQALGRREAAASAFQNARTTGNLAPELVAFVEQRLRQLQ